MKVNQLYQLKKSHPISKYLGTKKVIVLFCRGGFYKNEIILEKKLLELYPKLGKESYFVLDTFGIEPQIIISSFLTDIILFPINKSISNSLNMKIVNDGITKLNIIKKTLEKTNDDFVFIIPKKWIQIKQILEMKGWKNGITFNIG